MAIVIDGSSNDITLNGVSVATDTEVSSAVAPLAPKASPVFTGPIYAKDLSYKSTPVTITSWSYSSTTITINVASHTFVAWDYIEVAGLTATTYPANGIQIVTSVTATTIVFTLGATPTGTAGVSSATVKGYATVNGRVSESIGVNQSWQDMTSKRVAGITYANTTGKPIMVIIRCRASTAADFIAYVDSNQIAMQTIPGPGSDYCVYFVVTNGSSYSISTLNLQLQKWSELR